MPAEYRRARSAADSYRASLNLASRTRARVSAIGLQGWGLSCGGGISPDGYCCRPRPRHTGASLAMTGALWDVSRGYFGVTPNSPVIARQRLSQKEFFLRVSVSQCLNSICFRRSQHGDRGPQRLLGQPRALALDVSSGGLSILRSTRLSSFIQKPESPISIFMSCILSHPNLKS